MNKSKLIETVAIKVGIPVKESEAVINTFFAVLQKAMAEDERTEIRGFGTFKAKIYRAYIGRNPKNGMCIPVKSKRLPTFKASKTLKKLIDHDS
ncbi:MAG: integration host factor subunit beta [Deltaproteobacteria bacterium]|jgi:integration host factor subunit beta|nr:integration host factor subunit beta [Deltaproteobacteria bacterium]